MYIIQDQWWDIIVLNVPIATDDKSYDTQNCFYKELEQAFNQLPKYHMKMLHFSANVEWAVL